MSVDLSAVIYQSFEKNLAKAKKHFDEGAGHEAAQAYHGCAKLMERYAATALDPQTKASRLKRAKQYRALAENLETGKIQAGTVRKTPKPSRTSVSEATVDEDAEKYEAAIIDLIHKSKVSWSAIGGLESTKNEIKAAYGLTLAKKPPGISLTGFRNILLYGPPGTGKTLLAAATSNGLDATFFSVKVSDVLSKYFGESTKLVSALYEVANRKSPAVVFLDEFESLCVKRGTDESGAERRVLSTILAELDGLEKKDSTDYVLTIAATNTPWLLDEAALSRFEKKIYIPLPDADARAEILTIHLEKQGHKLDFQRSRLIEATQGYCGREIEQICKDAIGTMVQEMNPDITQHVDKGKSAIKSYQVKVRTLKRKDFNIALNRNKPGTSSGQIEKYRQWREGLA